MLNVKKMIKSCIIKYIILIMTTDNIIPDNILLCNSIMARIIRKINKEIKEGYDGIDIALDSTELCVHNKNDMFYIVDKLKIHFPSLRYEYDENADRYGVCCHHIHIMF